MAKHTPRFLQIVNDARSRVKECTVDDVKAMMDKKDSFVLIDVREESEFAKDHLPGAIHLDEAHAPDAAPNSIDPANADSRSRRP